MSKVLDKVSNLIHLPLSIKCLSIGITGEIWLLPAVLKTNKSVLICAAIDTVA